jgi:hypothetical protein
MGNNYEVPRKYLKINILFSPYSLRYYRLLYTFHLIKFDDCNFLWILYIILKKNSFFSEKLFSIIFLYIDICTRAHIYTYKYIIRRLTALT